jgi:hypothetical protein
MTIVVTIVIVYLYEGFCQAQYWRIKILHRKDGKSAKKIKKFKTINLALVHSTGLAFVDSPAIPTNVWMLGFAYAIKNKGQG